MGQQVTDGHAIVRRQLREEFGDLVLQTQLSLTHPKHDRRRREGLADRSQLEDRVLRDGQRVLGIPEAENALGYDLALFGVEPRPVEDVLFIQHPGQVLHHGILIQSNVLHKL